MRSSGIISSKYSDSHDHSFMNFNDHVHFSPQNGNRLVILMQPALVSMKSAESKNPTPKNFQVKIKNNFSIKILLNESHCQNKNINNFMNNMS